MERLDFDLPLRRFVGLGTQNNLASVILGISSQLEDLSVPLVRIPMMSATNSDLKSATYSNLKPAMVPI